MKLALKLAIYFVGIILPILAMYNCSGFNEGSMAVDHCVVDHILIRKYASFWYGVVTISSFMFMIPIVVYIYIVHKLAKRI